ncbi:MAG TPA: CsgG/HfaB family protein [Candidatus Binatia bacterium]|nr:CsgG/HfaB family protein [Candidatus Binatia bacterium]
MIARNIERAATSALLLAVWVAWGCGPPKPQGPALDASPTTQALQALPRYSGPKKTVIIRDFTSVSPQFVSTQAATDMMITALMKSGAFAVLDAESVAATRPTGAKRGKHAARLPYDFILKGVVSEANAGSDTDKTHLSLGGMETTSSHNADSIGIDLRIIDAESGVVIDSLNVRKPIQATEAETKGMGKLLGKYVKEVRNAGADLDTAHSTKESVDAALRACIEQAVAELIQRLPSNQAVSAR